MLDRAEVVVRPQRLVEHGVAAVGPVHYDRVVGGRPRFLLFGHHVTLHPVLLEHEAVVGDRSEGGDRR
eukprot:467203-Prymnesium_polylepis.1